MEDKTQTCPGCSKHCDLTAPRCSIGKAFAKTGQLPGCKGHKHKHGHDAILSLDAPCARGHHHGHGLGDGHGGACLHAQGEAATAEHAQPATMEERLIDSLNRLAHALRHGDEFRGGQGKLLTLLRQNGTLTQHELKELVDVRAGSLSEVLGKLEESGYIVRTPNVLDRRRVDIVLTEAGTAAAVAEEERRAANRDGLFGSLTEDEQAQLIALLEKLGADWAAQGREMHSHHCGHGKHACGEHGCHEHKHEHEHKHRHRHKHD